MNCEYEAGALVNAAEPRVIVKVAMAKHKPHFDV